MSTDQQLLSEIRALDEETRWNAIQTRDPRFDGIFFYGVRSTGIYCKPTCPSKRPRREQVAFFTAANDAERAGFRACRRCGPNVESTKVPDLELVTRACREMASNPDESLSLADLGARLGVSSSRLRKTFKSITGVTPNQYRATLRFNEFRARIEEGNTVTNAMYDAGFGSSSRLYENADSELGMTPGAYARGGAGMQILYSIVDCPLGRLLVAATERGLCAVRLGDSDVELEETLRSEFRSASIESDSGRLTEWTETIVRHLEGTEPSFDLPLDVQATAFQRRVWEELRRIPYGSTRSYGAIAKAIGQPTATRAVARACATNPVALVTPCHRVVREDGKLGGYRWGLERKRALLATEQGTVQLPRVSKASSE